MARLDDVTVSKLKAEVKLALKYQEDNFGKFVDEKTGAGEYIEMYKGNFQNVRVQNRAKGVNVPIETEISVGQVAPNTNYHLASSYYQNPKIQIYSHRKQDQKFTPIMERVINYDYRELGIKKENQFAIKAGLLTDLGCIEVGYYADFVRIPQEKEQENKGVWNTIKEKTKEMFGKGAPIQYNEFIRGETAFIKSVWPFHILFPPYITELRELPFIIRKVPKDMNFIHSHYPGTEGLKGYNMIDYDKYRNMGGTEMENFKQMMVYEFFMKSGSLPGIEELSIITFLGNQDGITQNEPVKFNPLPFKIEGLPFAFLQFNDLQDQLYGTPEPKKYADIQKKLNILITRVYQLARKYNLKILVNEDAFQGKGAKDSLLSAQDVFVFIKGQTPAMAMSENRETSKIPAEIFKLIDILLYQIRLISGVQESALAGVSQAEFATTEKIGAGGMQVRASKMSDTINDFIIEEARKYIQIRRQFTTIEEVKRIVGEMELDPETGIEEPIDWRGFEETWGYWTKKEEAWEWIGAEHDVNVDVMSMQKPDPNKDFQNNLKALEILSNPNIGVALQTEGKMIKLSPVIDNILKKNLEIQNVDKIIVPIPQQALPMAGAPAFGANSAMPPIPEEAGGEPVMPEIPPEVMAEMLAGGGE